MALKIHLLKFNHSMLPVASLLFQQPDIVVTISAANNATTVNKNNSFHGYASFFIASNQRLSKTMVHKRALKNQFDERQL